MSFIHIRSRERERERERESVCVCVWVRAHHLTPTFHIIQHPPVIFVTWNTVCCATAASCPSRFVLCNDPTNNFNCSWPMVCTNGDLCNDLRFSKKFNPQGSFPSPPYGVARASLPFCNPTPAPTAVPTASPLPTPTP